MTRISAFLLMAVVGVATAQPEIALSSLTVSTANLPEGCGLKPVDPPRQPRITNTSGVALPAPKPLALLLTNPWSGSDRESMARIRPALGQAGAVRRPLPDAFPRDERENAAWKLTDGISEAYRATYTTLYPRPYGGTVLVSAVRFTDAKLAAESVPVPFIEPRVPTRFIHGAVVATVDGDVSDSCFEAVRRHLQQTLR